MDRPLPDWTLREARAYCRAQHCEDCQMHGDDSWSCKLNNPTNWNLSGWSRYTVEEIALAKALLQVFDSDGMVTAYEDSPLVSVTYAASTITWLPGKAFPSVKPGEIVPLKDIAESE